MEAQEAKLNLLTHQTLTGYFTQHECSPARSTGGRAKQPLPTLTQEGPA